MSNSSELKVKYHGKKDKPTRKKNPNVASVSKLGYRDDSPYRSLPYIDIDTPSGRIDMSNTGIPLWANGRILPPYSGIHQFDTTQVKEIPLAQVGGPAVPREEGYYDFNEVPEEHSFYNMERAKQLYTPDETGHWPSIDYETGEWLKSKEHPTAWMEYLYGYTLNPQQALNYDVRTNPQGYFGENTLQYVPNKKEGGWLGKYQTKGNVNLTQAALKQANSSFQPSSTRTSVPATVALKRTIDTAEVAANKKAAEEARAKEIASGKGTERMFGLFDIPVTYSGIERQNAQTLGKKKLAAETKQGDVYQNFLELGSLLAGTGALSKSNLAGKSAAAAKSAGRELSPQESKIITENLFYNTNKNVAKKEIDKFKNYLNETYDFDKMTPYQREQLLDREAGTMMLKGISVDDRIANNKRLLEYWDEYKKDRIDYFNSPKFRERVNKQYGEMDDAFFENFKGSLLENLENRPYLRPDLISGNTRGAYLQGDVIPDQLAWDQMKPGHTYYPDKTLSKDFDAAKRTVFHEGRHQLTDAKDQAYYFPSEETIKNNLIHQDLLKTDPDLTRIINNQPGSEYYFSPEEFIVRLDELKRDLGKVGYDYKTMDLTPEILKKYKGLTPREAVEKVAGKNVKAADLTPEQTEAVGKLLQSSPKRTKDTDRLLRWFNQDFLLDNINNKWALFPSGAVVGSQLLQGESPESEGLQRQKLGGSPLPKAQKGGPQLPMHQVPPGQTKATRDSLSSAANRVIGLETTMGASGGNPIPSYAGRQGDWMSIADKISGYGSAANTAQVADWLWRAGWDWNAGQQTINPKAYILGEYYRKNKSYDPKDWDDRWGWTGRSSKTTDFDKEYANTVGKLSDKEQQVLVNLAKDWFFKNRYTNQNDFYGQNPDGSYKRDEYGAISSDYKNVWAPGIRNMYQDIMLTPFPKTKEEAMKQIGLTDADKINYDDYYRRQTVPKGQRKTGGSTVWLDRYQNGSEFIGPEEEQKPGVARVMGTDQEGTPVLRPTTGYYLPEVNISAERPDTYNNYMLNKYKDAGLGETMFMLPMDYAFGYPQAAMTKLFSGKYQLPSEAMGIENPVGAIATDVLLDPVNLVGAGLFTKERGFLKGFKGVPKELPGSPNASRQLSGSGNVDDVVKGFKFDTERLKDAKGFLQRRQFVKQLQKEGLIGKEFNLADVNYAARSTDKTNKLTQLALDRYHTGFRNVSGQLPPGGIGTQDYTGYTFNMNEPAYGRTISEFENMKNAGVDFSDPRSIAEYQATYIPLEDYGYRSTGEGSTHQYGFLFRNPIPSRSALYGEFQFKGLPNLSYEQGKYDDWFRKYFTDLKYHHSGDTYGGYKANKPASLQTMLWENRTRIKGKSGIGDVTFVGPRGTKAYEIDPDFPFQNVSEIKDNPEKAKAFTEYIEKFNTQYNTGWRGDYKLGGKLPPHLPEAYRTGGWLKRYQPGGGAKAIPFADIPTQDKKKIVINNYSKDYDYVVEGDKVYSSPKNANAWTDISNNKKAQYNLLSFINKNNYWGGYGDTEKNVFTAMSAPAAAAVPERPGMTTSSADQAIAAKRKAIEAQNRQEITASVERPRAVVSEQELRTQAKRAALAKQPTQAAQLQEFIDMRNGMALDNEREAYFKAGQQRLDSLATKTLEQREAQLRKEILEQDALDKGVSLLNTGIKDAQQIINNAVEGWTDAFQDLSQNIEDLYTVGTRGVKRKLTTYGILEDDDIETTSTKESPVPKNINEYYSTVNKSGSSVDGIFDAPYDRPETKGRQFKQQTLNVDAIKWGVRNRGDYKEFKSDGLEVTAFQPFTRAAHDDNVTVIAVDPSGKMHTGKYKDFKNQKGYVWSPTFMNKVTSIPVGKTGKGVYKKSAKNPSYLQPVVNVIDEKTGKEKQGSFNILVASPEKESYYGSVQGGRVLFVNPKTKEKKLVAGNMEYIRDAFEKFKKDAPYLETYVLDNGTYSRGLAYDDREFNEARLRSYDNENQGGGGNGLYIMGYDEPVDRFPVDYVQTPNVRTEQDSSYILGHPLKNQVKKVILHHTAYLNPNTNEEEVKKQYMTPRRPTGKPGVGTQADVATSHVVIEEDGKRTVYASPEQVTFHAGESEWEGKKNVNDFSIGVEFQGSTSDVYNKNGKLIQKGKPLTNAQIESFIEYYAPLAKNYNLSLKDVITHAMIAPGRKFDIVERDYQRILNRLKELGYK